MLQKLESQVLEIFDDLDTAVSRFAGRSPLFCPTGCGHCCTSEKVEATVLECIPLAFELFRTLQAELILKRLEKNPDDKRCILYRHDFIAVGKGNCTQYKYRAVICRLFGFAGNLDRNGIRKPAICRIMKELFKSETPPVIVDDPEYPMPLFTDAGMRITTLNQAMGTLRLPINTALLGALEKVGMFLDLSAPVSADTENDPEHSPEKPQFPRNGIGRRAA